MPSLSSRRDHVVVGTKVAGPSGQMEWIRGGPLRVDGPNIREALEGSLRRLGTDYVDILHLHWPDRCDIRYLLRFIEVTGFQK